MGVRINNPPATDHRGEHTNVVSLKSKLRGTIIGKKIAFEFRIYRPVHGHDVAPINVVLCSYLLIREN